MEYLGIDGCKGGWFVAGPGYVSVFDSLSEMLALHSDASVVLIDMPIGLPENQDRSCDAEARKLLAPHRHSSVFPVPCREAVYGSSYSEACDINEAVLGKRFPIQTWHILPKVREVDQYLQAHPEWLGRLRECHPELAFSRLNENQPLSLAKRKEAGHHLRLDLLTGVWPEAEDYYLQALQVYPRKVLAPDDILDALVLAWIARQPQSLRRLPKLPVKDSKGFPMEIVY